MRGKKTAQIPRRRKRVGRKTSPRKVAKKNSPTLQPVDSSVKPTGRPPIVLDKGAIADLAAEGFSVQQIAKHFNCSKDTLERNYMAAVDAGRHRRNQRLLRNIFDLSASNAAAAIWLSKQWLGMTDKLPDFSKMSDDELRRFLAAGTAGDASSSDGVDPAGAGEAGAPT